MLENQRSEESSKRNTHTTFRFHDLLSLNNMEHYNGGNKSELSRVLHMKYGKPISALLIITN